MKSLSPSSLLASLFQKAVNLLHGLVNFFLVIFGYKSGESVLNFFTPEDGALFDSSSDADIADAFSTNRGGKKFMNIYSESEAAKLIKDSPIVKRLSDLGYDDWYVEFDLSDCFCHYYYLRSRRLKEADQFLGFLIVQLGEYRGSIASKNPLLANLNMLNIRWLCLQNPLGRFTADKPRLPGQKYPGTGIAKESFVMFRRDAEKHGRDGIVNDPEHFHNAFGYKDFLFLDPEKQGEFDRLLYDLKGDLQAKGLAMVSWALHLGLVKVGEKGEKYVWIPSDQIFPLSKRMKEYFQSAEYRAKRKEARVNSGKFVIDWKDAERQCLSSILEYKETENSHNFQEK